MCGLLEAGKREGILDAGGQAAVVVRRVRGGSGFAKGGEYKGAEPDKLNFTYIREIVTIH
jgi:hypothetical protein